MADSNGKSCELLYGCELLDLLVRGPKPRDERMALTSIPCDVPTPSGHLNIRPTRHVLQALPPELFRPRMLSREEQKLEKEAEAMQRAREESQAAERATKRKVQEEMMEAWERDYDLEQIAKKQAQLDLEAQSVQSRARHRPPVPVFCPSSSQGSPSPRSNVQMKASASTASHFRIVHDTIRNDAKAGLKLRHCIEIIERVRKAALGYFKIGITEDVHRRAHDPERGGYVFDTKVRWHTMIVMHETTVESRSEAPMIEAALIDRYQHYPECLNRAPGGEGWSSSGSTPTSVYVVATWQG